MTWPQEQILVERCQKAPWLLGYVRRVRMTLHLGPAGQRPNRAWTILTCCSPGDEPDYLEVREIEKDLADAQ